MANASPTSRALAFCRAQGWTVEVVERWNAHAGVRQDFLGIVDIVVLDGAGAGPLAVQVTSGSNHGARVAKAKAEPRLVQWLKAPARFEVWSWAKQGARGARKVWTLRREALDLRSFNSGAPRPPRKGAEVSAPLLD